MDYMDIITRSLSNAWKYKFLWLFGLFVAFGDGISSSFQWTEDLKERHSVSDWELISGLNIEPAIFVLIGMAMVALALLFWVLSVLGEGALIHGVSRKELKLSVTFGDCWSAGLDRFFRLFGIMLLAILSILFVVFAFAMVLVPMFFASIGLGIVLTIMAVPLFIIILFTVIAIEGWAIRFGVLYNQPWLDAIGQGWNLFKTHVGKTIGVAFSSFLTQLVLGLALILVCALMAIPFILLGMNNLWLGLLPGLLAALVVVVLASAYFGTFASCVWTVGFMQLTGYQPAPAVATGPRQGGETGGSDSVLQ